MSLYSLAIFDFDGTLVDSAPGIIECMREIAEELGEPPEVWQKWSTMIGVPLLTQLQALFPERDAQFCEETATRWRAKYDARLLDVCPPFPGVGDMLSELRRNKVKVTIATSKRRHLVQKVLAHNNLLEHFDLIIGAQDVSNHKPHPESVHLILSSLKIDAARSVVIGDSTYDLDMAANAGVDAIGVTTGVHNEQTLKNSKPRHVVGRIDQALPLILNNR